MLEDDELLLLCEFMPREWVEQINHENYEACAIIKEFLERNDDTRTI